MATKIGRPLFNDGEGLDVDDVNAISQQIQALSLDFVEGMRAISALDGGQAYATADKIFTIGKSACEPVALNLMIKNPMGFTVLQRQNSAGLMDGLTPRFLACYMPIETEFEFEPPHATLDRIDLVCLQVAEESSDLLDRDFEDATTHVKSTQSMYTRKRTVINVEIVQGTPSATPVPPTGDIPIGYGVYHAVYVVNSGINVNDDFGDADAAPIFALANGAKPGLIWDCSYPIGRFDKLAARWYVGTGGFVDGGAVLTAANAGDVALAICPVWRGRVLGFHYRANLSLTATITVNRYNLSTGGVHGTLMGTAISIAGTGDKTLDLREFDTYKLPLWGNGMARGIDYLGGQTDYLNTALVIRFEAGATGNTIGGGRFHVVG